MEAHIYSRLHFGRHRPVYSRTPGRRPEFYFMPVASRLFRPFGVRRLDAALDGADVRNPKRRRAAALQKSPALSRTFHSPCEDATVAQTTATATLNLGYLTVLHE